MQLLAQEVSGGASDPRKPLRCGCCWLRGPPWSNKRVQDVTEATQLGVTGFKPRSACSQSPSSLHRTLGAVLLCSHVSLHDAGRLGSAGREARDACLLVPKGCWGHLIPRGHCLPSNFLTPWFVLCSVQADGYSRLCFSPGRLNPEGLTPKFSFHANHRGLCKNADFPLQ